MPRRLLALTANINSLLASLSCPAASSSRRISLHQPRSPPGISIDFSSRSTDSRLQLIHDIFTSPVEFVLLFSFDDAQAPSALSVVFANQPPWAHLSSPDNSHRRP